ncbi:MAG: PilX N-terminal domain-containing pilus assembly protein [Candidatus Thiodiazotropha lotti]|nr:PilX N-terminal domain-containing pilus assembly protein [Candidatus Thiodiazotropha lotti]MCG7930856.1 PilX N-terminal domain-containing pilus assembly protein [Candidatus Thiodiazotropha lotti]MCG8005365.1 PilX N-terminal domain-containing pilus assembly protein [Candidatus Thiodiazotropha lotti]MCG8008486.1 PilX N-terminal domain-containing pilus assembly protein [Candidatus Thiodiazotropha lotti]MCW4188992.1 PilX N-terminal domain-containing pilus assembly protein [Candidatus Thiodiazotr
MTSQFNRPSAQKGFALVVSMILLAIITMLSVSSMRNTNIETRIAVNHQLKELSFQAAENAISIVTGTPIDTLLDDYNLRLPTVIGQTLTTSNFHVSTGVTDQADTHADVDVLYEDFIDPKQGLGNRVYSGYQFDTASHLYLVDSTGFVDGSGTQTTNRTQAALIRM